MSKTVYWARIYRLDWWGYYDDSPNFETYKEAEEWISANATNYEDWFITKKEVNE